MMDDLIRILHGGSYTLVLNTSESKRGEIRTFTGRGISDLFRLFKQNPEILEGAMLADKVVGKGAASLMILGNVREVHADVISKTALDLFRNSDVRFSYDELVPKIWNRAHTDSCPVEKLCMNAVTAEACLPLIEGFVESLECQV